MNDAEWNLIRTKIGGLWPSARWGERDSALRKLFHETLRPLDSSLLSAALDEVRSAQSWHQPELRWIVEAYRRRKLAAAQARRDHDNKPQPSADAQTRAVAHETLLTLRGATQSQRDDALAQYRRVLGDPTRKWGTNIEEWPHGARLTLAGLIRNPLVAALPQK